MNDPARSRLPDLCQCVWKLDRDATMTAAPCLPHRVVADEHDSLKASYRCPDCLRSWTVWWDRRSAGWPVIARAA